MARMRDSLGDTDYMDVPARMLMETLKQTLGMWVNEISEDAAKRACERAHKMARERVAKALGEWAAQSLFRSTVDYQTHSLRITLEIPFDSIQKALGEQSGVAELLKPPQEPTP
jgi:hypothetical protein